MWTFTFWNAENVPFRSDKVSGGLNRTMWIFWSREIVLYLCVFRCFPLFSQFAIRFEGKKLYIVYHPDGQTKNCRQTFVTKKKIFNDSKIFLLTITFSMLWAFTLRIIFQCSFQTCPVCSFRSFQAKKPSIIGNEINRFRVTHTGTLVNLWRFVDINCLFVLSLCQWFKI